MRLKRHGRPQTRELERGELAMALSQAYLEWLLIQTMKLVAASRAAHLLQQSGRSKTTSFRYSLIRVATVYEGR